MKKILLAVALCTFISGLAFAEFRPIVAFKPYVNWNNTPPAVTPGAQNLGGLNLSDSWWMAKQDYFYDINTVPSFLDLGFELKTDLVGLVLLLDLRQDPLQLLEDDGKYFTNIPFLHAWPDLNFPHLGYVDFKWKNIYFSVGRRQVKWGPTTYDMAVSDSQPYLDNFFISYDAPVNSTGWNFNYSFMQADLRYFLYYGVYEGPKSLFTHRFRFENDFMRFAIAELNLVHDKVPNLLDYSPVIMWHNSYQDDFSNVMLNVSAEGLIGPVRLSGTFTMDDFDLPHEKDNEYGIGYKPQAMGFTAGIEVNLLDGNKIEKNAFELNDYAIKEKTFKKETGLNIGYEFYYCSTFMYNRIQSSGKYTVPVQFISVIGDRYSYDKAAFYLGFKYGPSTMVNRLYAEYTDNPFTAYFFTEAITRGSYGIESPYGSNAQYHEMGLKTMKLTEPLTTALKFETGAAYYIQKGFKVNGSAGCILDVTHKTSSFSLRLGASMDLCSIDWNKLF